ncbi:ribonuclease HI, partial [Bifidobacteriaceae bacterium N170]
MLPAHFLKGFTMIVVSTDGSALGNPNGSMGWAWADHIDEAGSAHEHNHTGNADAGGATNGTNQIGELCAVLEALRAHPGSEPLTIESDSQYAINCATTWIHGWKKNGWKNSKKEPVKNAELIRAIDEEICKRKGSVKFVWVKGHAGNAGNEKVDELARTYAEDCRSKLKDGYLPLEGWKSLISSSYSDGVDVPQDAKMLLDGKISSSEYHIGRCVGEDINPDFNGNNTRETERE